MLDLADSGAIPATVAGAEARMRSIDLLVNNAGIGMAGAIEEGGVDQIRALFEVNLFRRHNPGGRCRRCVRAARATSSTSARQAALHPGPERRSRRDQICDTLHRADACRRSAADWYQGQHDRAGRPPHRFRRLADRGQRRHCRYEGSAHAASVVLRSEEQHGDAALAAQTILAALNDVAPPQVLLLGDDPLHYAENELAKLSAEFERWKPLTRSIAAAD